MQLQLYMHLMTLLLEQIYTSNCNITIKSFSSLRGLNQHTTQVCARSLILFPYISSQFSSSTDVILLVGLNSIPHILA